MSHEFDAIVVGSGLTGAHAARELTDAGLTVLLIERGGGKPCPRVDGPHLAPVRMEDYPIQKHCYVFEQPGYPHYFVNDSDHPYLFDPDHPFWWIRGYQLGGRSALWAAQCYRWGEADFEANGLDGYGCDWPIRYGDIESWYSRVEAMIGLTGQAEGLKQIPDGVFSESFPLNPGEALLRERLAKRFSRVLTPSRIAQGPGQGGACPFCGGRHPGNEPVIYSSINGALPAALGTGRLQVRTGVVVQSVLYEASSGRATGVRALDTGSGAKTEFRARLIFLCAGTIPTNQILLNSVSEAFPEGIGNTSGVLGRYIMDHHWRAGALARFESPGMDMSHGFDRPWGSYLARFRNLGEGSLPGFLRGYAYQVSTSALDASGSWSVHLNGIGETLPRASNRIELDRENQDRWGLPLVRIHFEYSENEYEMRRDMQDSAMDMLREAGAQEVIPILDPSIPGHFMHEMGGARMGRHKEDSFLNEWNQCHQVPNLFVTDGACMTSSACQNPTVTYMALTSRACHFAVSNLKQGRL